MIAVSATNAPVFPASAPNPAARYGTIERRWITTREASRIVAVTEAGEAGLRDWPGVDLAQLRSAA